MFNVYLTGGPLSSRVMILEELKLSLHFEGEPLPEGVHRYEPNYIFGLTVKSGEKLELKNYITQHAGGKYVYTYAGLAVGSGIELDVVRPLDSFFEN